MTTNSSLITGAVAGRRPSPSGWIRANCPACVTRIGKADRKASFGLNVRTGFYHCFRCSVSGFADDAKREGDWADDPREDAPAPPARPAHFWPLFDGAAAHSECFADARDYVLGRGLELRTVKAAGVGACTRGDWAGRIIVPITSPEGGWLWHVGRAWSPAAVRPYMYPRGARKGLLYNASALARESDEPVLVVEGVFDALAHWPDAVAVLGKPTEEHIEALAAARRPVCVVLDGDAWREGEALAMRLQLEGQRAGHVKLGPRQDPDEVSRAEMRARARKSLGLAA